MKKLSFLLIITLLTSCMKNTVQTPQIINLINQSEEYVELSYSEKWDKWILVEGNYDILASYDDDHEFLQSQLVEVTMDTIKGAVIFNQGTGGGSMITEYLYLGFCDNKEYLLKIETDREPDCTTQAISVFSKGKKLSTENKLDLLDEAFWGQNSLNIMTSNHIAPLYEYNPKTKQLTGRLDKDLLATDISNLADWLLKNKDIEVVYQWQGTGFELLNTNPNIDTSLVITSASQEQSVSEKDIFYSLVESEMVINENLGEFTKTTGDIDLDEFGKGKYINYFNLEKGDGKTTLEFVDNDIPTVVEYYVSNNKPFSLSVNVYGEKVTKADGRIKRLVTHGEAYYLKDEKLFNYIDPDNKFHYSPYIPNEEEKYAYITNIVRQASSVIY